MANLTDNGNILVDEISQPLTDELPIVQILPVFAQSAFGLAGRFTAAAIFAIGAIWKLADRVLDFGLNVLNAEANQFTICSAEPATYLEATAPLSSGQGFALGAKDIAAAFAAPIDASPGRKVTANVFSDGSISVSGIGRFIAVADTVNQTCSRADQSLPISW